MDIQAAAKAKVGKRMKFIKTENTKYILIQRLGLKISHILQWANATIISGTEAYGVNPVVGVNPAKAFFVHGEQTRTSMLKEKVEI
jgi:hypothetical protein